METTRLCFSTAIFLLVASLAMAQEATEQEHLPQLRGAIMMANSHVPQATRDEKDLAIIPAWGIDLDYRFARQWSLTFQSDIKLQSFEIEDEDVELERSYPLAMALVMNYHLLKHWSFYVGPGIELEKHKNFFLVKAGAEYSFEITEDFEIGLNLQYENKEGVYDGWTFGVAFNKKLWEKH